MTDQSDSQKVERYEECKAELKKHRMKIRPNGRFFDVHDGNNNLFVFKGSVDVVSGFAEGLKFSAKQKRKSARRKK